MNNLPQVTITTRAVNETNSGGEAHIAVTLENAGPAVAVAAKLTLLRASDGERILPAYFSDNYVSLLPGEKRRARDQLSRCASECACGDSYSRLERGPARAGSAGKISCDRSKSAYVLSKKTSPREVR